MLDSILLQFMIIGLLGVGSQWLSWRFRLPAIVLMSIAGLLAGPVFGFINPEQDFGEMYQPIISIAVAIILFEGSLNLDIKEIRGLGRPVIRIVTIGALISWILGSFAAHMVAGLSMAVSFVIGAIFIVTGPTVILPLLRQSKLKPRPAKILKWEGVIVDPFGALLAVFAFEIILFLSKEVEGIALVYFLLASAFAVLLGWLFGKGIGTMFEKGSIPEFLKSPVVFSAVIACFTIADEVTHETGLLAVTAMGMTLANMGIASIQDMRHFKENISMLLISTIFIMLTASLTTDTLLHVFNIEIIGYVLLMLFVVRPLSIFVSTINTDLTMKERILVGWIAPRGIVALTVASYFASILLEEGFNDASIVTSLTFALVFFTVCAHGFSIGWLARKLDLSSEGQPGVLIVGSNTFSVELAKIFQELDIPTLLTDSSWGKLSKVRRDGLPFHHGEILSEQTEYRLDMTPYDYLISVTEYDSYNALVCTTFVPAFGRKDVFRLGIESKTGDHVEQMTRSIGGRKLFAEEISLENLISKIDAGYVFRKTSITEQYDYDSYLQDREEHTILLFVVKASKRIDFIVEGHSIKPERGDTIVSLTPPSKEFNKMKAKIQKHRNL
ncbi:sodium:proton antiporter [Aquibacillus koreensis]|uniref:Sodium:proton antiporter n=1 Tax=Aquibacillus koreensis TaxID=279446 RepID=A0A9X3WN26_9BACI|nr:sodium:proton antiporter [Aquibacillus koreensis]MCT2535249.1 sodium:proton antiporter [Aquibacillus koreensis]MDC3422792.1 sodium:proton antiporter [Aquibacillus koreensis]